MIEDAWHVMIGELEVKYILITHLAAPKGTLQFMVDGLGNLLNTYLYAITRYLVSALLFSRKQVKVS